MLHPCHTQLLEQARALRVCATRPAFRQSGAVKGDYRRLLGEAKALRLWLHEGRVRAANGISEEHFLTEEECESMGLAF